MSTFQTKGSLSQDLFEQVEMQQEIITNILGSTEVSARIARLKLSLELDSGETMRVARAWNRIIAHKEMREEEDLKPEAELEEILDHTYGQIARQIARNFVENRIEEKVQEALIERQDDFIDEMRMQIIRGEKGPENSRTRKRYQDLKDLDEISLSRSIINQLRPESFQEIIGQDEAILSLISKIASPYPQHIILYGPPGVGKTTAARIALEEARKLNLTPTGPRPALWKSTAPLFAGIPERLPILFWVQSMTPFTRDPSGSWRRPESPNQRQALSPMPMAASSSLMRLGSWMLPCRTSS